MFFIVQDRIERERDKSLIEMGALAVHLPIRLIIDPEVF
jgi:hypothetical protein